MEITIVLLVSLLMHKTLYGNHPDGRMIEVKGIVSEFGFSSVQIEQSKAAIAALLDCMPAEFHKDGGGGWSFLNLCITRDGEQWGEHRDMEALIVLGIAAGMAEFQMPRNMWKIFPGGMPYVVFDTSGVE